MSRPDFNLTISIPETELRVNDEGKQYTAYHVQVGSHSCKTQRTIEWRVLRRYSEFLELSQQLRRDFPREMRDVPFPPKRLLGRFNPDFVEDRRYHLQQFLEQTMEHADIINQSTALRAFVDIDKNLIRVMEQEKKDLLRLVEDTIRDPSKRQLLSQFQFARVLHPFEARNEEELGLPIGAIVIITDPRNNNGWYQGQYNGKSGYFPVNYVELLEGVPEDLHTLVSSSSSNNNSNNNNNDTSGRTHQARTVGSKTGATVHHNHNTAASHAPPHVPDPAVPQRLSQAAKIRRRTMLLDKCIVDASVAATAAPTTDYSTQSAAAPTRATTEEANGGGDASVGVESPRASSDLGELQVPPGALVDSGGLIYILGEALYPFKGETEFELTFSKGDVLHVYTIDLHTGWWQGKVHGNIGYFPGTYVAVPETAATILPVEHDVDLGESDATTTTTTQ